MQPIWFALHEDFLDLSPQDCFRGCFLRLYQRLSTPRQTHIERGEFVTTDAYERLPELALVAEIARLLNDLEQWQQQVSEDRENWLYASGLTDLPADCDLYAIFGQQQCDRLEQLRQRARMIARSLGEPKAEVDRTPHYYKLRQAGSTWRQVAAEHYRDDCGGDLDQSSKPDQKKVEDRVRSRVTEFAKKHDLPLREGNSGRPLKTREK